MYGRCPRCKRNLTISEAFASYTGYLAFGRGVNIAYRDGLELKEDVR
jgi:hypothetical protein